MMMVFLLFSMLTQPTWRVVWENDVVIIPLYESAEDYRYVPVATLYIDGEPVIDPNMYYETNGVERTFFSTINTTIVKRYSVRYRVFFPSYHLQSAHTIVFHVVDQIAPWLTEIPTFEMALGQKVPDFKAGLMVQDNYYPIKDLQITVDSSLVRSTIPGSYPIFYHVSDPSGNTKVASTTLRVRDLSPPEITLKKPVIIDVKKPWDIHTYFTFKDNYDKHLLIEVEDYLVDYERLGSYPIWVKATDKSGNQTTIMESLTIVDKEAPSMLVSNRPKIIDVNTEITRELLISFLLHVDDNYDTLTFEDVFIYHDIESDILGTYDVHYEIQDSSNNQKSIKVRFSIVDRTKPMIELLEPLVFDVFDPLPFFETMVFLSDNHTPSHLIQLKVTHQIKMNVVARYPITFLATDSSGNTQTLNRYVDIVDRVSPVLEQLNEIVISNFKKIPLQGYFSVTDQYDKPASIRLRFDDDAVNYETIGTYFLHVTATDSSGNQTTLTTAVLVVDILDPELELTHPLIVVQQHSDALDFSSFIQAVSDNYDALTKEDVVIKSHVDWSKVGRYHVTFLLKDASNNQTSQTLIVLVDDFEKPYLYVEDIQVFQHQKVDLKEGVDLSLNMKPVTLYCFPEWIDTSLPGTWVVTYIVQDERGNFTQMDRTIHILPVQKKTPMIKYLPVMALSLGGLIVLFWMHHHSKKHIF